MATKGTHRAMCSLFQTTGIGVGYESAVEEWIELAIERVVHKPIAHACFVYVAELWVGDFEVVVAAVLICSRHKVIM